LLHKTRRMFPREATLLDREGPFKFIRQAFCFHFREECARGRRQAEAGQGLPRQS
jgi:hypothetical protein